jgi:hypothetical protein
MFSAVDLVFHGESTPLLVFAFESLGNPFELVVSPIAMQWVHVLDTAPATRRGPEAFDMSGCRCPVQSAQRHGHLANAPSRHGTRVAFSKHLPVIGHVPFAIEDKRDGDRASLPLYIEWTGPFDGSWPELGDRRVRTHSNTAEVAGRSSWHIERIARDAVDSRHIGSLDG